MVVRLNTYADEWPRSKTADMLGKILVLLG